ncbi:MAG: MraY family glycosyltransferase [Anaerolineales bacterium]
MDNPNIERHKTHPNPVPLAGGLALFLSLGVITLIYRNIFFPYINIYLIIGLSILFITGFLDDRFIFTPAQKLFGQIVGSIFIMLGGIYTTIFNGTTVDWLITLFWLVGIVNAFNFLDGSDGMILETGGIILGSLVIFTQLTSQIIMMSIPIFDVTLVVYSRLRRHLPVYRSGLDHTYHRLLQRGFSPKAANAVLIFLVLLSSLIAYGALKANRYIAFATLAVLILTGVFLIYLLDHKYQPRE